MSTKLKTINGRSKKENLNIIVFAGAQGEGRCIDIKVKDSLGWHSADFTMQGAFELRNQLNAILDGNYQEFTAEG